MRDQRHVISNLLLLLFLCLLPCRKIIIPNIYTHGPDWHWLAYNLMEMTKVIDEEDWKSD